LIAGALALVCAVLVSGCSGESRPFSKASAPSGRTAPAISVLSMNGLPVPKAKMLGNFLQEASAKRDIAVVPQDFADSWKLTGEFLPQPGADGELQLVYGWTLKDAKGRIMHQISAAEPVGPAGGDVWAAVSPDSLRRVAGFTSENLASRLGQLGFATQTSGLIPPSDAYARAGPNAEKELDYETLYGHRSAGGGQLGAAGQVASEGAMQQPAVAPQPGVMPEPVPEQEVAAARQVAASEPQAEQPAAPEKKTAKTSAKATAIRGVTVTGVKGSPGRGNAELANAMRRVLKKAGWPVYDSARPDALNIAGNVKLGKRQGGTQKVALAWTVTSPEGKSLGTVRQANNVPAGSLDAGWGKTADYAAQAGAEGIFDLVGKLR
jgi:hypothetical protein